MVTRPFACDTAIFQSLLFASALTFTTTGLAMAQQPAPRLGVNTVDEVVAAMTVEEKVALLVGMGMNLDLPMLPPMDPVDAAVPEKVPGAAGRTHAIPRLGIPSLTLADGPAGLRITPVREGDASRTYYATAFPVATLMASSWDTALVHTVGRAFGREAREYGVDILLAPGMNLHRDPLGGRNFEYYSEDPLLSGSLAAAFIAGVQSEGVGTAPKHFAANNQEFNRMRSNSVVSERALREIYLRGFEIAVRRSQPWTVMTSYNLVNGTHAAESRDLLTALLRDEWGFEGFVMTDWFGGVDPVAMMQAGNDVLMPGFLQQTEGLLAAVADGALREAQLDANVRHVLTVVLQSPVFADHPYSNQPDLEAHATIARQAAAEGMVLLKNEGGALPLASGGTVALFGNAAYDPWVGGSGSGDVNEAYVVGVDDGLTTMGFSVASVMRETYRAYIERAKAERPPPPIPFFPPEPIAEYEVPAARIAELADATDVAVVVIGRNAGEFRDRGVEEDFLLTGVERALLDGVSSTFRAAGKPVVAVLNVAGVVEVASWRDQVDAILVAWQPGQEAGNAIADVVSGRVNPSGRLPMTFPMTYADVSSADNFPGEVLPGHEQTEASLLVGVPTEVVYEEGIYVGYRYHDTFGVPPAYPFGHGLSYTTFAHGTPTLSAETLDDELVVTVEVTNVGEVAGREVVQLYVSAPGKALHKPARELRGFAKTGVLRPGDSETVTFELTAADLASFDTARGAWVTEPGTHTVRTGSSAGATTGTVTFDVTGERVVAEVDHLLVPEVTIDERRPPAR